MAAMTKHSEYGGRYKKPPNMFFDILKNLKLGIEEHVLRTVNTINLEGIDFQIYPLRN